MNPFAINAFEFCRRKERQAGEFAIADLTRLADECVSRDGVLHWSVQGDASQYGHGQLKLSVSGPVMLKCQRCMGALQFDIDSNSVLVLARDDREADELEELVDNDTVDVVIGSEASDLKVLIEDEALLALPVSPRHEVCPDNSLMDKLGNQSTSSPFAILKDKK